MLDKLKKNLEVLREQHQDWKREIRSLNRRMSLAWEDRDYPEMGHIGMGYIEETIDQMPRLWAYTWIPKWAGVVWLVFWWSPD